MDSQKRYTRVFFRLFGSPEHEIELHFVDWIEYGGLQVEPPEGMSGEWLGLAIYPDSPVRRVTRQRVRQWVRRGWLRFELYVPDWVQEAQQPHIEVQQARFLRECAARQKAIWRAQHPEAAEVPQEILERWENFRRFCVKSYISWPVPDDSAFEEIWKALEKGDSDE